MDIESRIKNIIARVEKTSLSLFQKNDIYSDIMHGLHDLVWPTIIEHIPEIRLQELANATSVDVSSYSKLLQSAVNETQALQDLNNRLHAYLDAIELELEKSGI